MMHPHPHSSQSFFIYTNLQIHSSCPHLTPITVHLTPKLKLVIKHLIKSMGNVEWLIYLYGFVRNGDIYIYSYYLPRQVASATGVNVEEEAPKNRGRYKLLGSLHSHHNIGAFLSSTDISHHNYPLLLVVDKEMNFKGRFKFKLPCGIWGAVDVKVVFEEVKIKYPTPPINKIVKREMVARRREWDYLDELEDEEHKYYG